MSVSLTSNCGLRETLSSPRCRIMDWELSKENFQPLKRGRGPEKLQEEEPSPSVSKAMLDETRRWIHGFSYPRNRMACLATVGQACGDAVSTIIHEPISTESASFLEQLR